MAMSEGAIIGLVGGGLAAIGVVAWVATRPHPHDTPPMPPGYQQQGGNMGRGPAPQAPNNDGLYLGLARDGTAIVQTLLSNMLGGGGAAPAPSVDTGAGLGDPYFPQWG